MPRRIVAFVLWFEPLNAFRCHFATLVAGQFYLGPTRCSLSSLLWRSRATSSGAIT